MVTENPSSENPSPRGKDSDKKPQESQKDSSPRDNEGNTTPRDGTNNPSPRGNNKKIKIKSHISDAKRKVVQNFSEDEYLNDYLSHEISVRAERKLILRFGMYGGVGGAIITIIAFLGIKSYNDFKTTIDSSLSTATVNIAVSQSVIKDAKAEVDSIKAFSRSNLAKVDLMKDYLKDISEQNKTMNSAMIDQFVTGMTSFISNTKEQDKLIYSQTRDLHELQQDAKREIIKLKEANTSLGISTLFMQTEDRLNNFYVTQTANFISQVASYRNNDQEVILLWPNQTNYSSLLNLTLKVINIKNKKKTEIEIDNKKYYHDNPLNENYKLSIEYEDPSKRYCVIGVKNNR